MYISTRRRVWRRVHGTPRTSARLVSFFEATRRPKSNSARLSVRCVCRSHMRKNRPAPCRPQSNCVTLSLCCVCRCHMCPHTQACPLPDDKIVIYGGEDGHRRPLAEAHVLDLQVTGGCFGFLLLLAPWLCRFYRVCLQRSSCLCSVTCFVYVHAPVA
jgi:hypothetical protein